MASELLGAGPSLTPPPSTAPKAKPPTAASPSPPDLDGTADRATELGHALKRWKDWADGRNVTPTEMAQIAAPIDDHQELPGAAELGETLGRWADVQGLNRQLSKASLRPIGLDLDL